MRIGLVGCVKSKREEPSAAKDLYTSPLFRGARSYVQRSCDRWYILSAKHGLMHPDIMVGPYDETLTTASRSGRRQWSVRVLSQLDAEIGQDLTGHVFELHAGTAYLDFGLVEGLEARGAEIERPLHRLTQGRRLRFYKQHR